MQIPMEIFGHGNSLMDIGSASRQRGLPAGNPSGNSGGGSIGFEQVFDRANMRDNANRAQFQPINTRFNQLDSAARFRQAMHQTQQEIIEDAQIYYAAELAKQTDVTYILEVDKKSAILPESMYEAETLEKDVLKQQMQSEAPQPEKTPDNEPQITAQDVKTAYHDTKAQNAENLANTDVKAEKPAQPAVKPFEDYMQNEKLLDNKEATKGEIEARMPTSEKAPVGLEQSAEQLKNATQVENGEPSHLENVSDSREVKGEKFELRDDKGHENQSGAGDTAYGAAHLETDVRSQSIRGNAQMQEMPDTPVTKDNLFDEMVSRINVMQQDGRQEMTIQLKPEFLGNLSLKVAIENGGLHVKIDASDAGVRGLVSSQMQQLIQELENKGMTVVEVEVTHTGINNGDFNQQGGGHGGQGRSHKSYNGGRAEENASIIKHAIQLHEYYVEQGVSSVQYSA